MIELFRNKKKIILISYFFGLLMKNKIKLKQKKRKDRRRRRRRKDIAFKFINE